MGKWNELSQPGNLSFHAVYYFFSLLSQILSLTTINIFSIIAQLKDPRISQQKPKLYEDFIGVISYIMTGCYFTY